MKPILLKTTPVGSMVGSTVRTDWTSQESSLPDNSALGSLAAPFGLAKKRTGFWSVRILLLLVALLFVTKAEATHLMYGTMNWEKDSTFVSPGQVRVRLHVAMGFRLSFFDPNPPDQIGEQFVAPANLSLSSQDGSLSTFFALNLTTTAVHPADPLLFHFTDPDWVVGETTLVLTLWTSQAPFTAEIFTTDRLSSLRNGRDKPFRLATVIDPTMSERSPVTSLPPIIALQRGIASSFIVPAVVPFGQSAHFRLATPAESGNPDGNPCSVDPATGNIIPSLPEYCLRIDPLTGRVTWNTSLLGGFVPEGLWTVQFIIEGWGCDGALKATTPIDLILDLRDSLGLTFSAGGTSISDLTVPAGSQVQFKVSVGSVAKQVTLSSSSLPAGSTMSPSLPVTSSVPAGATFPQILVTESVFNWTPTLCDVGAHVLTFFLNVDAAQMSRSVTVNVTGAPTPIVVTSTADAGEGSLRKAIQTANECFARNVIEFAPSAYGTITLESELCITDDVTINGPGRDRVILSGGSVCRVFNIRLGSDVTLSGLTITGGQSDRGGAILNDHATLTVKDCYLHHNTSGGNGGGIYNDGVAGGATLNVLGSTFAWNNAAPVIGLGGGIMSVGSGGVANVWAFSTTFTGNLGKGAAVYNQSTNGNGCSLSWSSFRGCTFSDNLAPVTTLPNGTIVSLSAAVVSDGDAPIELQSTILNRGTGSGDLVRLVSSGGVFSRGWNLFSEIPFGVSRTPEDIIVAEPLVGLGPLQDNGGLTPTHALDPLSMAIDRGITSLPPFFAFVDPVTDQRGLLRTLDFPGRPNATGGDGTDIGAFELQNTPPLAKCKDVIVFADSTCSVNASIDDGSNDPDGDTITTSQSPAGPYSLGTNTVMLIVTDCHGASNTCTATVTVVDTTPPSLSCPSNQTFNATGPSGAIVNYTAATASDNCGSVSPIYSKNAGTLFSIGDTTVNVTATDAATNAASCSFTVHVKGAAEQINDLIAKINALPDVKSPNKTALVSQLQTVLAALAAKDTPSACKAMQAFINLVKAQAEKKLISAADAAALTADAVRIRAVIGCP